MPHTPTPKLGKGLGRKPDVPDKRDRVLPRLASPLPLPTNVDVFQGLTLPVYDQGNLGSCTANAGVLYRRFLAQRFSHYSAPDEDLSRLNLYYQERKLEDDIADDSGAQMRDIVTVLESYGVAPAPDDPYDVSKFADATINDSKADAVAAAAYKIGAYHRVPDVDTAKSCLASGYAVLIGFTVYASFENIGSDGVMPMPLPNEQVLGGHAVCIHGYDDSKSALLIQNSWGADWGLKGSFWMPYEFVSNTQLSDPDMWIGHLGPAWK